MGYFGESALLHVRAAGAALVVADEIDLCGADLGGFYWSWDDMAGCYRPAEDTIHLHTPSWYVTHPNGVDAAMALNPDHYLAYCAMHELAHWAHIGPCGRGGRAWRVEWFMGGDPYPPWPNSVWGEAVADRAATYLVRKLYGIDTESHSRNYLRLVVQDDSYQGERLAREAESEALCVAKWILQRVCVPFADMTYAP